MSNEPKVLDFETFYDLTDKKQKIDFLSYDVVDLEMCDLGEYKKIAFKKGAEVNLGGAEPLPQELDVSQCASVDLSGRDLSAVKNKITLRDGASFSYTSGLNGGIHLSNVPPLTNVDFSRCAKVTINGTELSHYKDFKFKDGADVSITRCTNLPENIDFSQCEAVQLSGCDLSNQQNLKFKDGATVDLSGCTNIPETLDLSHCERVILQGMDLSQVKNLKFKEGAQVDLSGCTNIPENIDFSVCAAVNLSQADLSNFKELKLKDGASLDLSDCKRLPEKVDFDKCAVVNLSQTDLLGRTDLKFRDGAIVDMSRAENIPEEVDFSTCAQLNLSRCDLSSEFIGEERTLSFREGAEVNLSQCKGLPQDLDFSKCQALNLSGCDLQNQGNLTFRDNARVSLVGCANVPASIEASQCKEIWITPNLADKVNAGNSEVIFSGIGVQKVDMSKFAHATTAPRHDEILGVNHMTLLSAKEFVFKDRQQYQDYLNNPNNLSIPENTQIIFADEQRQLLAQNLAAQQGELPQAPKASSQDRRITRAVARHEAETKSENTGEKAHASAQTMSSQQQER